MPTFTTTPATAGSDPSSFYGTLLDLYDKAGEANVKSYSSMDGEDINAPRLDRIQSRMLESDAKIDTYLSGVGYTGSKFKNGTPNTALKSDPAFPLLSEAWAWLTVAALYNARGMRDMVSDAGGNLRPVLSPLVKGWNDTAADLLRRYAMSKRRDISTSVAFGTGCRERGSYPCG